MKSTFAAGTSDRTHSFKDFRGEVRKNLFAVISNVSTDTNFTTTLSVSAKLDGEPGDDDGSTTPVGSVNILFFENFNGQFDQGTNLDPARADIRIHNPGAAFPTFYWNFGLAISASLWEATKVTEPEWVIVSLQDEDGNLIPFGQAVTYGDYSVPNTQPGMDNPPQPSPLVKGGTYVFSVTRSSDFSNARIMFKLE